MSHITYRAMFIWIIMSFSSEITKARRHEQDFENEDRKDSTEFINNFPLY